MNEVTVTWGRALKIWWSFLWRGVLYSFFAGIVMGIIMGIAGRVIGLQPTALLTLHLVSGLLVGIPIGIWIVKIVVQKKFSDFRIALLEVE